jgi:hypothetical protein
VHFLTAQLQAEIAACAPFHRNALVDNFGAGAKVSFIFGVFRDLFRAPILMDRRFFLGCREEVFVHGLMVRIFL